MTENRVIPIIIIVLICSVLFSDPPNWQPITGTQYSMVVMAQITFNNELFDDSDNNMVGAFGPGEEEDCRSVAIWQPPTPECDGFWYFTIVGNINEEAISFKIYNSETDTIYNCFETIIFEDGTTIGIPTDLFEITCGETTIDKILTVNKEITLSNYPNPFKSKTTISFITAENKETTKIIIYNIKGQKIKTFHINQKTNQPVNQIVWDGSNENNRPVGIGIYFYRLNLEHSPIKKIILFK
ncbi:MAG TPA: T9SS type A sorting domain-containing protein [Candidatus Cloacimonetes bacterium]|nr:T9SS type A sorting domain-containing protein [Candidatus Cloacimonadota bacterium]